MSIFYEDFLLKILSSISVGTRRFLLAITERCSILSSSLRHWWHWGIGGFIFLLILSWQHLSWRLCYPLLSMLQSSESLKLPVSSLSSVPGWVLQAVVGSFFSTSCKFWTPGSQPPVTQSCLSLQMFCGSPENPTWVSKIVSVGNAVHPVDTHKPDCCISSPSPSGVDTLKCHTLAGWC